MYYLHYNITTGAIIAPYCDLVHGKQVTVYNTDPLVTKDGEGNEVVNDPGTVPIGTTLDLSAIPEPYTKITDAEHDDWMQNQSTRKIEVETKKLVEYMPPEPAPVIIKPSINQDLADVWEAILAISAEKEGGN